MRARPHTRRPVRRTVRRIIHRSHTSHASVDRGQLPGDTTRLATSQPSAVAEAKVDQPEACASPGPAPRRPAWF
jgi:hypothetical protein